MSPEARDHKALRTLLAGTKPRYIHGMSPDAKNLLRKPRRWDPVDIQDLVMALVCSHLLMLFLGYVWGKS